MKHTAIALLILMATCKTVTSQIYHYPTHAEMAKVENERLKIHRKSFRVSVSESYLWLFPPAIDEVHTDGFDAGYYHHMPALQLGYYPTEHLEIVFLVAPLLIPKEQTIDSIQVEPGSGLSGINVSGSGRGGLAMPVTLGLKKTFTDGLVRPFISLQAGFTWFYAGAGAGSGSIGSISSEITYQKKMSFTALINPGIQVKIGHVVGLETGLRLYASPAMQAPAGGMHALSGLSIYGSLSFTLNPGRTNVIAIKHARTK